MNAQNPTSAPDSMSRPRYLLTLMGAILMVLLMLRIFFTFQFNLFVDEAIYLFIAEHSPVTFIPHPPGISFLIETGKSFAGRTEFGIRIFSIILGALFPIATYLLGRQLLNPVGAAWAGILLLAVPVYNAFGVLATPDMPLLFLWTTLLLLTWRALQTHSSVWWIVTGAMAAIALTVKYIAVLYFPALLLYLFLSGDFRHQWRKPGPYIMLVTTAAIMIALILSVSIDAFFVSVKYHLSGRQRYIMPSLKNLAIYQGAHMAYFSPLIYGIAIAGIFWSGRQGMKQKNRALLYLFCFSVTPWLVFLMITAFTRRILNREHWDSIAYVTAVMAGIAFIQARWPSRRQVQILLAACSLGFLMVAGTFVEAFTALPSRIFKQTPAFASLLGWDKLSQDIDDKMDRLPPGSFVLTSSFPMMVEHNFYSRRQDPIYTLNSTRDKRYGVRWLWEICQVNENHLVRMADRDGIFVYTAHGEVTETDKSMTQWHDKIQRRFQSAQILKSGNQTHGGDVIRQYLLIHGTQLRQERLRRPGNDDTSPR